MGCRVPTAGPSLAERSKSATGGERLRPGERDGHGGAPGTASGCPCPGPASDHPLSSSPVVFTGVCRGAGGVGVFWLPPRSRGVWGLWLCGVAVAPVLLPGWGSGPLGSWGQSSSVTDEELSLRECEDSSIIFLPQAAGKGSIPFPHLGVCAPVLQSLLPLIWGALGSPRT